MKKTITFAIMALIALTSQAQLKVDSLGRIKVGSNLATSGNNYNTSIGTSRNGALYIHNSNKADAQYGINVTMTSSASAPVGISSHITAQGASIVHGVKGITTLGYGQNLYKSIGVLGEAGVDPFTIFSAGIVGSAVNSFNYPDSGNYAGYFYGDVLTTGSFLGTLLSPGIILSQGDGVLSTNGRDGSGMQVVEKLQSVDLLQVRRVNQNGSMPANKKIDGVGNIESTMVGANGEGTERVSIKEPVQTKLSPISYGLAADQLKEVYPELVYEDKEGNYSINYIEMVPLLVQSIKELSAKVTTLEEQLGIKDSSKKAKQQATGIEDSGIEVVSMSQNRPNPFKDKSVISLNVPSDTKQAVINIYDMSGKQVQSIPVSERGRTNITVYASLLQPGMFIYSLLVDGKVQTTRKMMVTE